MQLKGFLKTTFTDGMLPGFLDGFILELPYSVKDDHEKFFDRKNAEINRATTFDELFFCLSTYWDYLNFSLLEGIIDSHGTAEMLQKMECYVSDVEAFCEKTKLKVFWQLQRHRMRTKPPPGFSQFVTKHCITGESTLKDVENIRREISDEFHLQKCALLLVHVVEGSVVITWFVPSSAITLLKQGLGRPEVLAKLHIESVEFFDEVESPDAPVGEWLVRWLCCSCQLIVLCATISDYNAELAEAMRMQDQYNLGEIGLAGRSGPEGTTYNIASLYRLYVHTMELLNRLYDCVLVDPLQTAFLKAAVSGNTATVTELLELVEDTNARDPVHIQCT